MASQEEILRSAVPPLPRDPPKVSCEPFHAEEMFHATRILILASATLARSTSALSNLQAALGTKVAGVKFGLRAHTYFGDILAIAEECRVLGVDLIVTLGGGSLTDAAKIISLVLANDVKNSDELLKLPTLMTAGTVSPAKPPTVSVIIISTTLSGGEFTFVCGTTDDRDNQKHQLLVGPAIKLVILDAALVTATTPLLLFVQSGVRALDHCIEALCSVYSTEVTEMPQKRADVQARLLCQMASIDAVASCARVYSPVGGSHAIGHILGPFGVVHGATSGILLPAVCKYNARYSADAGERQATAKAILWSVSEMRSLAESKGLVEGVADLGDLLDVLVRQLGMARTLAEVGVGRDKFEKLAEFSVLDPCAATNPVPLKEPAQVMEILEMVAK
ncbi:putative Fe-containing alcohol dehydrogenase [Mycena olivaceomarginata]|nr:putative Fe-containing alcohol dehydrogenase [Mycena olivaceomarginata]